MLPVLLTFNCSRVPSELTSFHGEALRAHLATTAVEVRGGAHRTRTRARPAYDTARCGRLIACLSFASGCEHGPLPNSGPHSPRLGLAAHALDRAVRIPLTHPLALSLSPFLNARPPPQVWLVAPVNASSPLPGLNCLNGYTVSRATQTLKGYTLSRATAYTLSRATAYTLSQGLQSTFSQGLQSTLSQGLQPTLSQGLQSTLSQGLQPTLLYAALRGASHRSRSASYPVSSPILSLSQRLLCSSATR
jgi:hypothetical protein